MIDNKDERAKQQEIEDFFAQFDKISDDFYTRGESMSTADTNSSKANEPEIQTTVGAGRSKRHADKEPGIGQRIADGFANIIDGLKEKFTVKADDEETEDGEEMSRTKKNKKKKKYRFNWKKALRTIIIAGLICCLIVGVYAGIIIHRSPDIDPDNIYTMLAESSVLYDCDGNVISTVGATAENRTIIEYSELPANLCNAFIAIEDKTFWEHHGFNVIRIFGAIKDAVFSGNKIGGTSTITQQLARNVYLTDTMSTRSIERKIAEAYYSVQIEKALSKEQILEAYLNTINLGFNSHGVQAAAQAYFSKDVEDLDLIECAALASLPKSPSSFALIKRLNPEDVNPETDQIIYEASDYIYVYNGDKSENRRLQTLKNMVDQGLISQEEREAAEAEDLFSHMNPNISSLAEVSSYFADYVIEEVIDDLMNERHIEYSEARDIVYNNGLQIYTTMDSSIQKVLEQEYANPSNFPGVTHLSKDKAGNIVSDTGKILLYQYSNILNDQGLFVLGDDEYQWLPGGSMKLLKGKRLNFYKTSANGESDVSIEFKNMYVIEDGVFYSIGGGTIMIPQGYKTKDEDGNCIISSEFFANGQEYIATSDGSHYFVDDKHYSLKQKVIQPQSAMVITDYTTGHVKAMVGGRNTVGRLLFNRAVSTRQPGSSIKPICVYGAALQKSLEAMEGGTTPEFETYDNNGNRISNSYGTYMTAASVIDDAPLVVDGKQWPKNWYVGYRGLYTLRTAVEQSVNVCAVKVFQQVGPEYAAEYAKGFGLSHIVESGESNDMNAAALALGGMTNGETPLEMASAYGTYANGGLYMSPICYTTVTNKRGEILLEKNVYSRQACDPGVAFIMTDILRTTVSNGIAGRAAIGVQPVAGKTGTTTDNYDAWFVGFTPQYSAACWIGNDINIELSEGSAAAAKLWSKVMKQVCADLPAGSFKAQPENVISVGIDTKSGLLPTDESSYDYRGTVRNEYFISGTQPTAHDNVHTYVQICNESGKLATPFCTNTSWKFGVQRPYLVDPNVEDIAYEVPHYYCPVHNPDSSTYPTEGSGYDPTGAYTPDMPEQPGPGTDTTDTGDTTDVPVNPEPPVSDPLAPEPGTDTQMPSWLAGN